MNIITSLALVQDQALKSFGGPTRLKDFDAAKPDTNFVLTQRVAHQAKGQPVDMDNASIIATFPADLGEEVLLTSSEAVLSAFPSPLLAEAQMLRDRAMSHYQARSLFGNSHRQTILMLRKSKPLMLTTEFSTSTGKALFDGQLLDVYFTRSFYKHILGVKVTYHDIEAVDPDYYKNLKWLLENDVSDILDLTFSMDADEEKQILYAKFEVTDHELKLGGRNIRVTEETKHEHVDLVADHILTNAIRPQINSFLEGFNELIPRDLISIINDKELEFLISGLPEIDLDDLKSSKDVLRIYIESSKDVLRIYIKSSKDVLRIYIESSKDVLRIYIESSKDVLRINVSVPLEGFKALQDLPEYTSKEQLQEQLLLAIHEASEGGTWKTFLWITIISALRAAKKLYELKLQKRDHSLNGEDEWEMSMSEAHVSGYQLWVGYGLEQKS
ncbi:E3 ubiquitin protein ligase UPL1 [Tanacetum coccineum]